MNARRLGVINILATGVITVTLTALGLFWTRWLCAVQRDILLPEPARKAAVDVSRLLESWTKGDPNGVASFKVEAHTPGIRASVIGLGLPQYVESRMPGGPDSPFYRLESRAGDLFICHDSSVGQIVHKGVKRSRNADGTLRIEYFTCYAGPGGIAETSDEKLGRFLSPIVEKFDLGPQIVYDRGVRRFFAIDWSNRTVRQGPELPNDGMYSPVQIRMLLKNPRDLLILPFFRREANRLGQLALPAHSWIENPVLVLDASGRIDLFDAQTLHFVGVAGRLASPTPVLGSVRQTGPGDVIAYEVAPIGLRPGDGSHRQTYGGCSVATLSREGVGLHLDVFDANGCSVGSDETRIGSIPSAKAAYFHLPSAQVLTLIKFTLENLHPPAFLALSHLAAPNLEATAGYRSIFLLPDSFVAMSARDAAAGRVARFFRALLLVCPALLLALQLAWFVTRDGARVGLSKNARAAWVAGTVLFGLPAYLTYRLTRPRVTLVTCQNCGQCRRPDLEKCHRCGSPWTVPELTPPAWRVLGEQEQAEESLPLQTRQADSSAQ